MKKVLFTASVPKHIMAFHLPYLEWFKKQGYEVHVACNEYMDIPFSDKVWVVPFSRSPLNVRDNFNSFLKLKKILDNECFDLISTHTPVASIITRLSGLFSNSKSLHKMMYTAHGFHFFKGGPLLNWLLYFPLEVLMSYCSDYIVCINEEDYSLIRKRGSNSCKYFKIPGIGVKNEVFFKVSDSEKSNIRSKLGFLDSDFIMIYAAEFIERKNHKFIIDTVYRNLDSFSGVKIILAGSGVLYQSVKEEIEAKQLCDVIHTLGFRTDIDKLYKMADIGFSVSKQEGLGINLIEAMLCGNPIVASEDRGHKEILSNYNCGFLYEGNNEKDFLKSFISLRDNPDLRARLSKSALRRGEFFLLNNSLREMSIIYKDAIS
ncbi:hypothetical protein VHA01S_032_00240 [Vibrio halioticoli NBRC 102217]|uniref:Glycosyltransferase n=1 Tax=Vibrio halioticoli NBRC 102217 TaxID=1219072 RepID=V5F499_9VIBR|nr:glycosyltransferase [Vibrio halioticoli]GAD90074.1 hypothetical protein VHA01S_032_00240 [Vibrio halioticoli NBRC 102217]